jgi:L-histidine N-alpha-methyltransferase
MIRPDRSPLTASVANELRDALGRRQKELPARWLAARDAASLRAGTADLVGHRHETTETQLGLTILRDRLRDARPRGVVCVQPSASAANLTLADTLCDRGGVQSIAAAEWDSKLAVEMLERVASRGICESSSALACDFTVDLPLPDDFPRPRVYFCLGNTLGTTTPVGAVRMLRILRSTMAPNDSLVLGLEARRTPETQPESTPHELDTAATRHLDALELLNATVGASFDVSRFDYKRTYDVDNHRVETHLVARRAVDVSVPGVCDVRFRKGESIRTSVSCCFDRPRVAAMLAGVGLGLHEWTTDSESSWVVALARPAV